MHCGASGIQSKASICPAKQSHYDFIDFGASTGACIEFAKKYLGGVRGVGIDINPEKIKKMQDAGYDCIMGDINKLEADENCVKFITMSHVLEHLRDRSSVKNALRSASRLASDFLYIRGPSFDDDEYLENFGVRWYWSHWRGHTYHLTTSTLHEILNELGLYDLYLLRIRGVNTTDDNALHPLESPIDQHGYNVKLHPPKQVIMLDRVVYKEFICFVRLRPFAEWKHLFGAFNGYHDDDSMKYGSRAAGERETNTKLCQGLERSVSGKDEAKSRIRKLESELNTYRSTLNRIYNSNGWKLLRIYYKIRNRALPTGSWRREKAKHIKRFLMRQIDSKD